jgi:hypothetical protein
LRAALQRDFLLVTTQRWLLDRHVGVAGPIVIDLGDDRCA